MQSKTVVITGATSGIGLAISKQLAMEGYAVIGIGRNEERCASAQGSILDIVPVSDVRYVTADLYHQREITRIAAHIGQIIEKEYDGKLFALINNAGCAQNYYNTTEDGFER